MITVDFLISFGSCKKLYFETRKEKELQWLNSKDYINRSVKLARDTGGDPQAVREALLEENNIIREKIEELVRGCIQITADSLNRQGYSEEQVREMYKS